MLLGKNGFPLGWNAKRDARWKQIKNDPNPEIQRHWNKLAMPFKYLASDYDPQYILPDLFWHLTHSDFGKLICGSQPYSAFINGKDFRVNFLVGTSQQASFKDILDLIQAGNKITFSGTVPSAINTTTEYFITPNVMSLYSGTSQGGNYSLIDNTVDFIAKGVEAGDVVINKNTGEYFFVFSVEPNKLGISYSGDSSGRQFSSPTPYEVKKVKFSISTTANGQAIDAGSGQVSFQPFDKVFYFPEGCGLPLRGSDIGNDELKEGWQDDVIIYGIYHDVLTPEQRKIVVDIFYNIFIGHTMKNFTGAEYDYFNHGFCAAKSFALLIKDEFPDIFAKVVNHPWFKSAPTMVQALIDQMGGNGQDTIQCALTGTNYDPSTYERIVRFWRFNDDFEGVQTFPDMYGEKPKKFCEYIKAYLAPLFQWGDNQHPYSLQNYFMLGVISTFADLTDDPEMWYLWDYVAKNGDRAFDNPYTNHNPHDNPYAPRCTQAQWETKFHNFHANSAKRALTFYHSEAYPKGVQYACIGWSNSYCKHNLDGSDIQIVFNGEEMLGPARRYSGKDYLSTLNNFIPFGAFGIVSLNVQRDYKRGATWVYTKNRKSYKTTGYLPNHGNAFGQEGGWGNIIGETKEQLFYMTQLGTVLLIERVTLETPNGNPGTSIRTNANGITYQDVPNNILNFENMFDDTTKRMAASRYRHNFNWHIPVPDPEVGPNKWSWYGNIAPWDETIGANGKKLLYGKGREKITLETFIDGYIGGVFDADQHQWSTTFPVFWGTTNNDLGQTWGYFIRLQAENEQFGKNSWFHALHVNSPYKGHPDADCTKTANGGFKATVGSEVIEVSYEPFQLKVNGVVIQPDFSQVTDVVETEPAPTPDPTPTPGPAPVPTGNTMPKGMFDGVSGDIIYGWTYDPNNPELSNKVKVSIDGAPAGDALANVPRPDVNTYFGIIGNHGFQFKIPTAYKDGVEHTVSILALDVNDETQAVSLGSSGAPMKFTLQPVVEPPPPPPPDPEPVPDPTPPPADTIPPKIKIVAPVSGKVTKKSMVKIKVDASDETQLVKVEFYINQQFRKALLSPPFDYSWSVPAGANKKYALQAIAYDSSGNSANSNVVNVVSE